MKILFYSLLSFIIFCTPIGTKNVSAKNKVLDIQEVTSKGGIKAWLVEDHALPIINIKFAFKGAGAIQNSPDKQGLSQLLSNTMDEGAGDLTSQEFQKSLSDHSITLHFNSSRDDFGGYVKTLIRHKDKAFELLKLALNSPRFDSEPIERMRQANISRIRSSIGNPEWINARFFNDIAFEGHPYALNSGGTLTTLNNITVDDLKAHKESWLTKDRLIISVTGDIKKEELSKTLDDIFGALPATGEKNKVKSFELKNTGKTFLYKKDIPQTIISSAMPSFGKNDPDYDALRVMNYIYGGGGFGSRLMEEAREKRGLTYGIYSSLLMQDNVRAITVSTSTKNESVAEMKEIIANEMTTLRNTEVTAQELKDAQSYITGSMPLSLTSTDKVSNILLNLQLDNRSIDYLDGYVDRINNVTISDIKNVANRVLNPEKLLTIMVGQPTDLKNIEILESLPNVK